MNGRVGVLLAGIVLHQRYLFKKLLVCLLIIMENFLFIELPSKRRLAYVKPRIGENRFGGESVTFEGIGATKKWERIESYSPKFVENIVQAISRDILIYAMKTLRGGCICGYISYKYRKGN